VKLLVTSQRLGFVVLTARDPLEQTAALGVIRVTTKPIGSISTPAPRIGSSRRRPVSTAWARAVPVERGCGTGI
jgi:hypothetical protein